MEGINDATLVPSSDKTLQRIDRRERGNGARPQKPVQALLYRMHYTCCEIPQRVGCTEGPATESRR